MKEYKANYKNDQTHPHCNHQENATKTSWKSRQENIITLQPQLVSSTLNQPLHASL